MREQSPNLIASVGKSRAPVWTSERVGNAPESYLATEDTRVCLQASEEDMGLSARCASNHEIKGALRSRGGPAPRLRIHSSDRPLQRHRGPPCARMDSSVPGAPAPGIVLPHPRRPRRGPSTPYAAARDIRPHP